jgi:hypothetical protein
MWAYSGSSCPDRPSSEELSATEVEARMHKALDLRVILIPSVDPIPIRRGITSARVSTLGPISVAFMILSFHCAHDLAQGLGGSRGESRDADLPVDAIVWEARHASNRATRAREERKKDQCATSWVVKKRGMKVHSRSVS